MEHIFDESMNIDENVRETRRVSGGGGVSNLISSTTESANKLLSIPLSLGLHKYTFRFSKSRIFYTYGYSFKQITKKHCIVFRRCPGFRRLCLYVYTFRNVASRYGWILYGLCWIKYDFWKSKNFANQCFSDTARYSDSIWLWYNIIRYSYKWAL